MQVLVTLTRYGQVENSEKGSSFYFGNYENKDDVSHQVSQF